MSTYHLVPGFILWLVLSLAFLFRFRLTVAVFLIFVAAIVIYS